VTVAAEAATLMIAAPPAAELKSFALILFVYRHQSAIAAHSFQQ